MDSAFISLAFNIYLKSLLYYIYKVITVSIIFPLTDLNLKSLYFIYFLKKILPFFIFEINYLPQRKINNPYN